MAARRDHTDGARGARGTGAVTTIGHQGVLECEWLGGVVCRPWVVEDTALLGFTPVVPLGVVGTAVPDGFVPLG